MSIDGFLRVAISVTAALEQLHLDRHRCTRLTPETVILEPQTETASLLDTTDSTAFDDTPRPPLPSANLDDDLAYISPEQTGRINRVIDYRSDFYSLGVLFYQLLTGTLPFTADDALEWVHCHIARHPTPPTEVVSSIPEVLSGIIMRLLAKTAEERYQTASGLLSDLKRCQIQWHTEGAIGGFLPGADDVADFLLFPQKLYGREDDLRLLLASLDRVVENDEAEMILLAGYSGIGKTSLIKELYQPTILRKGTFLSGKFDQFKRNIPYLTIAEAFREPIRQILSSSEKQITIWRERFLRALGINGRLLIEILPSLELIIGPQPPVEELPPQQRRGRFHRLFRQFVGAFCDKEHPVVLFFDDLQWIDGASLGLLTDLITAEETRHLLLIGAYRDNEVDPSHPLMLARNEIAKSSIRLTTHTLRPLGTADVHDLLADTFRSTATPLPPFSSLVYEKTGGNPFFIIQFLQTLHGKNLLALSKPAGNWQWDIDAIRTQNLTDNVVDLVITKVETLAPEARHTLQLAACIGNSFNLSILPIIGAGSEQQVRRHLNQSLQEGLIVRVGKDEYAFLHDRVQQAAHLLISKEEQARIHLQIGRLLLQHTAEEELEEQVFAIVHQLNQGLTLLVDDNERYRVAELNVKAGKKAKASTAYSEAFAYLDRARQLLSEKSWEQHYHFTFELYRELATTAFLKSDYDRARQLIDVLLHRARSNLEKAKAYNILIVVHTLTANYSAAIQSGREALSLLGITLPETELEGELKALLAENDRLLGNRPISSLIEDDDMTDPEKIASLEILSNMVVPARYTDSTLFALISVQNVNISLRHGLSPKSTVGYTAFGMVLNSTMGRFREALAYGEVAWQISERFNSLTQKCQASFMIGHYLNHWVRPLREAESILHEGLQAGLASGEMQWTGYTFAYKLFQPLYAGVALDRLAKEIPRLLYFTRKTKNHWATHTLLGLQLALSELNTDLGPAEMENEEEFLALCENHNSFGAKGRYMVLKAQILYLLDQPEKALEAVASARQLAGFFSSSISVAALNFYHSLILARLAGETAGKSRADYEQAIKKNQNDLKIWADTCPENFHHLYLLVEAELTRLADATVESEHLYEKAIKSSQQHRFPQDQGLASELAARFYRQRGFAAIADTYLLEALRCYDHWQAKNKVEAIERDFPRLVRKREPSPESIGSRLDALIVAKASQAISGSIEFPDLLDTLMRIVLEHAGAEKGYFISVSNEQLIIDAGARVIDKELIVQVESQVPTDRLLPISLLNHCRRTLENVIYNDVPRQNAFENDYYFFTNTPLSLLCLPIIRQSRLVGLLYLENSLTRDVFTSDRLAVLDLLSAQAAISLENAKLYLQRRRDEEAMRISEQKYRAIIENSGVPLIFIEDDMTINLCNRAFEELCGASKEDIEGRIKWTSLVASEEDLKRMKQYHRDRRIDPKKAPKTYEFQLINRHQERKDVIVTVTVLPGTRQSMASMLDITERKRAVEALHESERKFRAVFDQTFQYTVLLGIDGAVLEANQAVMQFTGNRSKEIIGTPFHQAPFWAHSTELQQRLLEAIDTAARGGLVRFEATHPHKDGNLHYLDFSLKPVKDDDGAVVLLIAEGRDITEQKLTQVALEEKVDEVQLLLDSSGEGIYGVDPDGRCTFINPAAMQILGYSEAQELLGLNVHNLFHHPPSPASAPQASQCLLCRDCGTDTVVKESETSFRRHDGTPLPVEYTSHPVIKNGKVVGAVCTFHDISHRKEAEDRIVRLATIVEQAVEGVVLTDLDWTVQYVNPAFEHITGYDKEEIIGQRIGILKSSAHNRDFYKNVRESLMRGEVWSGRLINTRKDGTLYEVDATGSPVRDETGKIINFVGIQHDITNEIRLEHQLRQAQKMEAIGTLAGGIAHDFNNILAAILGHSQLMEQKLPNDSPLQQHLHTILDAGHRATDLVSQILTVSRPGEHARKPLQITPIIKEVLKLIRSSIPTTIDIIHNIESQAAEAVILADATEIHQVLMNLCTNAAHAMDDRGGVLSLKLSIIDADSILISRHHSLQAGRYARLVISDTGHGMDDKTRERIFDPYFTTKSAGEGTGLGLATVLSIVKNVGGIIDVASEPDHGSTFTLFFPVLREKLILNSEHIDHLPRGSEHILLVDDETVLVDIGHEVLTSLGYRVSATSEADEAIRLVTDDEHSFDLVLTDMNMPGISGIEIAKEIQRLGKYIPVILCTGYSTEALLEKAKAAGIDKVMLKPYDISKIATTIRELLAKRD